MKRAPKVYGMTNANLSGKRTEQTGTYGSTVLSTLF